MKTFAMMGAAALVFVMTPVAAYADCRGGCSQYCGQAHPSNPSARAVCHDGCMVGCVTGPTIEREE